MKALAKSMIMSAMVASLTLVSVGAASADDYGRRHHRHNGDGLAIGAAGLAAGVLLGGALASQPRYAPGPVYVDPDPVYVDPGYEPAPVYRPRRPVYVEQPTYYRPAPARELRPWSQPWMRYCSDRYQSFDPRSGTYIGYDNREHFCTAGG